MAILRLDQVLSLCNIGVLVLELVVVHGFLEYHFLKSNMLLNKKKKKILLNS